MTEGRGVSICLESTFEDQKALHTRKHELDLDQEHGEGRLADKVGTKWQVTEDPMAKYQRKYGLDLDVVKESAAMMEDADGSEWQAMEGRVLSAGLENTFEGQGVPAGTEGATVSFCAACR